MGSLGRIRRPIHRHVRRGRRPQTCDRRRHPCRRRSHNKERGGGKRRAIRRRGRASRPRTAKQGGVTERATPHEARRGVGKACVGDQRLRAVEARTDGLGAAGGCHEPYRAAARSSSFASSNDNCFAVTTAARGREATVTPAPSTREASTGPWGVPQRATAAM